MTPQINELLNSGDPNDRKRTVRMMAQSAGPAALPYLAALYKTDPDPDIRAVVQAGRYIKAQQQSAQRPSAPATPPPAPAKPSFDLDQVQVSEANRRRSEEMIDRALNLEVANDKKAAEELVRKAVKLNPHLVKDAYYGGIVSSITGKKGEDALVYLLDDGTSTASPTGAQKRENDDLAPATAGDALLSLVVLWLLITGLAVAMSLLLPTLVHPAVERFIEAANMTGAGAAIDPADFATVFAITGANVTTNLIAGVLIGLQSLIVTLITYVIYHAVALFMLGGDGSFFGLIINATPYQIVQNLYTYGVAFATVYLCFNSLLNATADLLLGQINQGGYSVALANATSPLLGLSGVSVLFSIVMVIWLSSVIGKTYQFGTFKGCMTLVLSVVVMVAIGCWLCFLAGAAVMGALQSIAPQTLPSGAASFRVTRYPEWGAGATPYKR